MSEREIRARLESLVDRWLKASPAERLQLIHEKIRLEEMLDEQHQDENAV
ncbi:MAG TPA: hypothetical protein VIL07_06315 [Symbiobacteriaceae bacterium]